MPKGKTRSRGYLGLLSLSLGFPPDLQPKTFHLQANP